MSACYDNNKIFTKERVEKARCILRGETDTGPSVGSFWWRRPQLLTCLTLASLLCLALLPLPYGYYTFLRLAVVVGSVCLVTLMGVHDRNWAAVFLVAAAILFNPFMPIRLNREIWFWIDLATAGLFVALGTIPLRRKAVAPPQPDGSGSEQRGDAR